MFRQFNAKNNSSYLMKILKKREPDEFVLDENGLPVLS